MKPKTWQHRLFDHLRAQPHAWVCVGQLFEEYKPEIPMHTAMRAVNQRYGEADMPSYDKAQWMLFTHTLRDAVRVERENGIPHALWLYTDRIRLLRLGTCGCGGQLIKDHYGSSQQICLDCGDLKPIPSRGPKPGIKPVFKAEWLAQPEIVARLLPRRGDKPTIVPAARQPWVTPKIEFLPRKLASNKGREPREPQPRVESPTAIPTISRKEAQRQKRAAREKPATRTVDGPVDQAAVAQRVDILLRRQKRPKQPSAPAIVTREPPSTSPASAVLTVFTPTTMSQDNKPVPSGQSQLMIVKNLTPQGVRAHMSLGGTPLTPLGDNTWLAKVKNLTLIIYRDRLWKPRQLAQYLKTILRSLSLNHIEGELRRCGYRPVEVLRRHQLSDNLNYPVTVNSRPVGSFVELVRAMNAQG